MPTYATLHTPRRNRVFAQLRSIVARRAAESGLAETSGQIVINFPAMPDVIELARHANYVNMAANSPATPDGFHIYRSTDPLKIPITFAAHAFDQEYVGNDGPVALLQIAARLHALALPIIKFGASTLTAPGQAFPLNQATNPAPTNTPGSAVEAASVKTAPAFTQTNYYNANDQVTFFPVPCLLNILFARRAGTEYGIRCFGFVEDVAVKLKAPWLQGSSGAGSMDDDLRNLPSTVEYSFTFVHQPGFTNEFLGGRVAEQAAISSMGLQAMAADVYQRLYNQIELDKLSSRQAGGQITLSGADVFGQ